MPRQSVWQCSKSKVKVFKINVLESPLSDNGIFKGSMYVCVHLSHRNLSVPNINFIYLVDLDQTNLRFYVIPKMIYNYYKQNIQVIITYV